MAKYLGREETVSVGIQSGSTSVAPQIATRHLKNGIRPVVNKKKNTSAMGRPEQNNGSAVMSRWSEGPLEFKLQDRSIGYYLYALMGGVTTTNNADASGTVKDHAFPVTSTERLLTIGVRNLVDVRRYANTGVSAIEISSEAGSEGDYVMVAVDTVGGVKEAASDTPAYLNETEFTQAHVTSKLAANLAGLSGAALLETTNIKLRIQRNKTPFVPHGFKGPVSNDTEPLLVTGELTLRYKLADLEANWDNNDRLALEINIENTDVTIGTSAKPKLNFKLPQITFETFDRTDDLDSYVEQTIAFDGELNTTAGYAIATVLTNTQATYAAA